MFMNSKIFFKYKKSKPSRRLTSKEKMVRQERKFQAERQGDSQNDIPEMRYFGEMESFYPLYKDIFIKTILVFQAFYGVSIHTGNAKYFVKPVENF